MNDLIGILAGYEPWQAGQSLTADKMERNARYQAALGLVFSQVAWLPNCYGLHPISDLKIAIEPSRQIKVSGLLFISPSGRVTAAQEMELPLEPSGTQELGLVVTPKVKSDDGENPAVCETPFSLGVTITLHFFAESITYAKANDGIVLRRLKISDKEELIEDPNYVPPCMAIGCHPKLAEIARLTREVAQQHAKNCPALYAIWTPPGTEASTDLLPIPHWYTEQCRLLHILWSQPPFSTDTDFSAAIDKLNNQSFDLDHLGDIIANLNKCWDIISGLLSVPIDTSRLRCGDMWYQKSEGITIADYNNGAPVNSNKKLVALKYEGSLNEWLMTVQGNDQQLKDIGILHRIPEHCGVSDKFKPLTFIPCQNDRGQDMPCFGASLATSIINANRVTLRIPTNYDTSKWFFFKKCDPE